MIENLAITTWSHTSYSDIWNMYYGQFENMAPFFKHYMFINERTSLVPEYCTQIVNDETQDFGPRVLSSLENVKEQNIIWMQEDFVLYDSVDEQDILELNNFLNNSNYDFIKLMKSGINGGKLLNSSMGIYEVPSIANYLYSLQATIWKKEKFFKLYDLYKPKNMVNAELFGSVACRNLNIKGCYVYKNENKRGNNHWDSSTFPYIATALYGGSYGKPAKWQTSFYNSELNNLLKKYNIDKTIRGEI